MVAGMSLGVGVGVGVGALLLLLLPSSFRKKEIMAASDPGKTSDPREMMIEADKLVSPSNPLIRGRTKLLGPKAAWSPDWMKATLLYKQAADGFMEAKDYQNAIKAYEKASQGQKILLSPFNAAKHMESAAVAAEELNNLDEACAFYETASELYLKCEPCGRSELAVDALAKGAMLLEDSSPDKAVELYEVARSILEKEGMIPMLFRLFFDLTLLYYKLERYCDAANILLQWGSLANEYGVFYRQRDAYLGAIILYLYEDETCKAEKSYHDWNRIETCQDCEEMTWAKTLIHAYKHKDINEIKLVEQSSTIWFLELKIFKILCKLRPGRKKKESDEEEEIAEPERIR